MRTWKIVAVLASLGCLAACANHVPDAGYVSDAPPPSVLVGGGSVGGGTVGGRAIACVAVAADAGADAGATPRCAPGTGTGHYDGSGTWVDDGSVGYYDSSGTWVDDGDTGDTTTEAPGDEGSVEPGGDESTGGEGSYGTESVRVNLGAGGHQAPKSP